MLERVQRLSLPYRARILPAEQVHLTLQFIGDTPAAEMDATAESVRRAAAGLPAFTLSLNSFIRLPERGPARLIAVQTDSPTTLMELQKRLAQRLARHARQRPGDRFRPHLTLCRFASPVRGYSIETASANIDGTFAVDRIMLMRSTLSNTGATHHSVETIELRA
jgi:2'-5' RNA ligase